MATLQRCDLRLKTCLHLTWVLVMSCELLVACCCTCLYHACRRHLVAAIGQTCIMWTELQRSGITFADMKHLKSVRSRLPDLCDFIQDPGHHQQPCVYIRLSPWHSPYYIGASDQDVLRREHSRCRKYLQLLRGQDAFFEPALHYWKRSNNYWLFCAVPIEIKLPTSSVWIQESKWQYMLRPHLNAPWVHRLLRKIGFRENLVDFRRHSLSSPTSLSLHKRFRRRLHPDLHRQLRPPEMLDDIQAHYSTLYRLGSNTASFQTMRELLSAAFPSAQLYYFLRLSSFVNEPFRSKARKLLAQVLRKRQLQVPTTMTQLLLPPLHVRDWKAKLGTWLQRWGISSWSFSLFLPKIRVVETRSATLGDRIYNYRKWQRRWTPDTSFPCRCIDMDDRTTSRAHSHAVLLDELSCINADIDSDIMAASMKDQYFGDVNKLQQRFDMQIRKLARRWQVQGSSFTTDYQPILAELFADHRSNVRDRAHWTSASLQHTTRALSSWVVIPADHFPSRAHVICPSLFSMLLHKTFCTGEVFALCRESAASFRAEVVTMIPARLQHRYAWGLRLPAPLPTARILPKPTKDWLKARPITNRFLFPHMGSTPPHGLRCPYLQAHQGHLSRRSRSALSSRAGTTALGYSVVRGPHGIYTVGITRPVRFLHIHSH